MAVMSATFAGDRWVQVLSTGGKLTGCGGGTKAVKHPVSPQHHSPTTADQSAAKFHYLPANKHSTADLIVVKKKNKKTQTPETGLVDFFLCLPVRWEGLKKSCGSVLYVIIVQDSCFSSGR